MRVIVAIPFNTFSSPFARKSPSLANFTTAYDEYAVKAFRLNAIDYLLKPINPDELTAAVEKVASTKSHFSPLQLEMLKQVWNDMQDGHQQSKNKESRKLAVSTQDGVHFIDLKDIVWCESLGAYTKFHLVNKTNLVVSKLIKEYEDILSDYEFIRIHQSYIINLQHVKKYSRIDGGTVEMSDGSQIEVSRRRKDDFQKILAAYSVNEKQ
jgi:two-component system, LytTR family, response regulator